MRFSISDVRSEPSRPERPFSRQPAFSRHARLITGLLLAALFLSFRPAAAADSSAVAASSAARAPALTPAEAQQLLDVLNDPQKRAAFTSTLSLLAKSARTTAPSTPAATPATTPATTLATTPATTLATANTVVSQNAVALHSGLLTGMATLKSNFRTYIDNFIGLFADLKTVETWLRNEISSPDTRHTLLDAFGQAGLILLVALALEWVTVLLLHKPLLMVTARAEAHERRNEQLRSADSEQDDEKKAFEQATRAPRPEAEDADSQSDESNEIDTLETREKDTQRHIEALKFIARIPYSLGHIGLKLIPVGLYFTVAFLGAAFATRTDQAATVTETLAGAYAIARCLFVLVESALAPRSPTIRLAPVADDTARMLTRWWEILVAAPSIVVCLSVLGGEFDLAERGTAAMIRAIVLVEHLLLAAFIWQLRPIIARNLAPRRMKTQNTAWAFILTLAQFWWIPALFLDGALWLIWAIHLRGGYEWILRSTVLSVVVIVAFRLIAVLAYGWQDKLFRLDPAVVKRHPEMQVRADRYYPFARGALSLVIAFVGFIALTEAWGIGSFHFFFESQLGSRLLDAGITLLVAVSVAVIIWEIANMLLNRQMDRFDKSGQSTKATRLKTVLPIIRTVLLVMICIIVLVTSLSQLGINIAPLLTGAGILGAAIAFGAQSLVKDFITGFFMLVEDAIQVGDWVTAGGVAGWVENISIRTVRVRAIDGDLHIIPFSSVSSIANTARGWNQIIINQTVDVSENIPRVVKILADTVREMRKEDEFRTIIYSDYNDLGVNNTSENGSVLIGSIRTAPMMKWKVQREFYKRIANRMAQAGVKFYTPTTYTASAPGTALQIATLQDPPAATSGTDPGTTSSEEQKHDTRRDQSGSRPADKH